MLVVTTLIGFAALFGFLATRPGTRLVARIGERLGCDLRPWSPMALSRRVRVRHGGLIESGAALVRARRAGTRASAPVATDAAAGVPAMPRVSTGRVFPRGALPPSDMPMGSDRLTLLLSDGFACAATLCALFIDREGRCEDAFRAHLTRAFDARFAARVDALRIVLRAELDGAPLIVAEQACQRLRDFTGEAHGRLLLRELETIVIESRDEPDLGDHATLRLLRLGLGVEFPVLRRRVGRRRHAGPSELTLAPLLSLLATSAPRQRAFERASRGERVVVSLRHHPVDRAIAVAIERDLDRLAGQPLAVRRAFVRHCRDIIAADDPPSPAERVVPDLIAAALDSGWRADSMVA